MRRVHRNLSRDQRETLRRELTDSVPTVRKSIPALLRTMRLITRKSQTEYARLCGVAPRVLTNIEASTGRPTVETLEKLLKPFGYRVGVVQAVGDEGSVRAASSARAGTGNTDAARRARETIRNAIERVRAKRRLDPSRES